MPKEVEPPPRQPSPRFSGPTDFATPVPSFPSPSPTRYVSPPAASYPSSSAFSAPLVEGTGSPVGTQQSVGVPSFPPLSAHGFFMPRYQNASSFVEGLHSGSQMFFPPPLICPPSLAGLSTFPSVQEGPRADTDTTHRSDEGKDAREQGGEMGQRPGVYASDFGPSVAVSTEGVNGCAGGDEVTPSEQRVMGSVVGNEGQQSLPVCRQFPSYPFVPCSSSLSATSPPSASSSTQPPYLLSDFPFAFSAYPFLSSLPSAIPSSAALSRPSLSPRPVPIRPPSASASTASSAAAPDTSLDTVRFVSAEAFFSPEDRAAYAASMAQVYAHQVDIWTWHARQLALRLDLERLASFPVAAPTDVASSPAQQATPGHRDPNLRGSEAEAAAGELFGSRFGRVEALARMCGLELRRNRHEAPSVHDEASLSGILERRSDEERSVVEDGGGEGTLDRGVQAGPSRAGESEGGMNNGRRYQTSSRAAPATSGGAAHAAGEAVAAPLENPDQQAERNGGPADDGSNNAWEQYNIGLFVKLFLLLFLFDAGREVYLMTLVLLLLHINGFFSPLIHWMRESSHPQPLEVTLARLRYRRERRPLRRLQRRQRELRASTTVGERTDSPSEGGHPANFTDPQSSAPSGGVKDCQEVEEVSPLISESRDPELEMPGCSASNGKSRSLVYQEGTGLDSSEGPVRSSAANVATELATEGEGSSTSSVAGKSSREGSPNQRQDAGESATRDGERNSEERRTETVTAGNEAERDSLAPSYMERVLYQGVVMFVLTLFPSWNPNPDYLLGGVDDDDNEYEDRETDE
ncbi:multi-pass transmembrane protein [Cystoisospora suis]|uniref:Multi-pass transmembrane protein n=1 Tax=Cystoisospora suis TaxID=483139 RepID=A0A2C6KNT7_9APIC|nr:multi-pass transmembrane protein [Cystoisospora suis]